MTVYENVVSMIAKQLKIDPKNIHENARLLEDLHADSANVMMLVMDLEQACNIVVEDEALTTLKTVGDVVRYIEANT